MSTSEKKKAGITSLAAYRNKDTSAASHRRDDVAESPSSEESGRIDVPGTVSTPKSQSTKGQTRRRKKRGGMSRASTGRGPWFNAEQTATYLALPSPGAVRELERRGVLPGHRLGGSLRLSRLEIDTLLLEFRQPTVTEISEDTGITAPPAEGLGPLMNPEQAIVYLGLPSTAALDHRVRRGEVPCYRIGSKFLFRAVELDAAMKDERRRKPRRLSAAERQLTCDDLPRTVGHGRPPVDEKGGH